MRETLERKCRAVAEENPGKPFDDVVTLLGAVSPYDRRMVIPRLLKMLGKGGPLRDLVESGTIVPTEGRLRAECWQGFQDKAVPPTLTRESRSPAIVRVNEAVKGGHFNPEEAGKVNQVLQQIEHSGLSTPEKREINELIVNRVQSEAQANERAEGWKEAAVAWRAAFHAKDSSPVDQIETIREEESQPRERRRRTH